MKAFAILVLVALSGCAAFQPNTDLKANASVVNEFCSHSKTHRDILMMGVSEEIEPHSIYINCNCAYGFECENQ